MPTGGMNGCDILQMMKNQLNVVIPVHNEAAGIASNLAGIIASLTAQHLEREVDWQLLVVDDGSTDDTLNQLETLARNDPRIQPIAFTRNFGKESAILAGLRHSGNADVVVVMDSDLQHPPDLIGGMLSLWRQGYKVVTCVKDDRGEEGLFSALFARTFYRLFRWMSGYDLANHTDFKLLDREVVTAYCDLPEGRRFFRGLIAWLGYPSASIRFAVPRRGEGSSAWTRIKLMRYAVSALTDFSAAPLYLITWLGGLVFLLGLVLALVSVYQKLTGTGATGFTTLIVFLFLTTGPIMVSLGLIGHYLGELFLELKGRPSYVIRRAPDAAASGGVGDDS
jgi:glycosyltransferase involved in cell wall biosynthesis